MNNETKQVQTWSGEFGREYTDRNYMTLEEMQRLCSDNYGRSRTQINQDIIGDLDKNMRILEVGCNIGNQLLCLKEMGFNNLYGIELQEYAVERLRRRTTQLHVIQGSAFDIPFKEGFFDLVFTSGVLIHIAPEDLSKAMGEIHRCSRRYIWGTEYWAEKMTEVNYRGNAELLWKTDYAKMYQSKFKGLKVIKDIKMKHLNVDGITSTFLLEKC